MPCATTVGTGNSQGRVASHEELQHNEGERVVIFDRIEWDDANLDHATVRATAAADNRMGRGIMRNKTQGMSEAELAERYDRTHDVSEFDEGAAYPAEVRRNITISVRFSDAEIEALRHKADAAGVKVTAYIRAAALQGSSPVDQKRLRAALKAVADDVARAERIIGTA